MKLKPLCVMRSVGIEMDNVEINWNGEPVGRLRACTVDSKITIFPDAKEIWKGIATMPKLLKLYNQAVYQDSELKKCEPACKSVITIYGPQVYMINGWRVF